MQEIKPTYVTFKQAKWLKEKGFDVLCNALFVHEIRQGDTEWKLLELFERDNKDSYEFLLSCDMDWQKNYLRPEQWQVVEWLRVNHGIWVWVESISKNNKFCYRFRDINGHGNPYLQWFDLPQEAYSAAFDYIKDNNLI